MNQQVEHIAKERPYNAKDKFGIEEAGKVLEWLEESLAAFTELLPCPPYSKDWLPPKPQAVSIDPAAPGASAHPTCSSIFTTRFLSHSESAATHV
jgi:hypothetical protein